MFFFLVDFYFEGSFYLLLFVYFYLYCMLINFFNYWNYFFMMLLMRSGDVIDVNYFLSSLIFSVIVKKGKNMKLFVL